MPIGRGRETLGQRLVRTIAEVTTIETTSGTEHTELLKPETFPKGIFSLTGNMENEAGEASRHVDGPHEILFWM